MHCVFCLTFILLVYVSCGVRAINYADRMHYAICNLQPNTKLNVTDPKITGQILFKQSYPQGKLEAHFAIKGFPLNPSESTQGAIHIHTYGDLSDGCVSAGGHYNPESVDHPYHPGDFGNFLIQNGEIQQHWSNLAANMFGTTSIIGRSAVIHKFSDDLGTGNDQGSREHGNAGPRLACCVVGITTKDSWLKLVPESDDSDHY